MTLKKKKIILWTIFAVSAICATAVGIDAAFAGNLFNVAFFGFIIMIGLTSVRQLIKQSEVKETQ